MTRCFQGSIWQDKMDKKLAGKWCRRVKITFSRLSQAKKLLLCCKISRTGSIRGTHPSDTQYLGGRERAVVLKPNGHGCLEFLCLQPANALHRGGC